MLTCSSADHEAGAPRTPQVCPGARLEVGNPVPERLEVAGFQPITVAGLGVIAEAMPTTGRKMQA